MEIVHYPEEEVFILYNDEGRAIGEITYRNDGCGAIRVPHTEVNPSYEGQGLAGQLLDALVCWVAEKGLKVVPVCPYVVRAFRKHPEKYADVMK